MLFRRKKHPHIQSTMQCDYRIASEFNKELLIRNFVKASRTSELAPFLYHIPTEGIELEVGNAVERALAEEALEELVENGFLNRYTYRKEFV